MATIEEVRADLKALRAKVVLASQAARTANDPAKVNQLGQLLGKIDDELDDLAIEGLAAAAARLGPFRQRLEELTRIALSWPFGSVDAPQDHERPHRDDLPPNDFADQGPAAPPPPPPSDGPPPSDRPPPPTVPTVSPEWSENYRKLWDTMTINLAWHDQANAIAQRMIAKRGSYDTAVAGTSVPWWFVAIVHCMECSLRFDQHLHNGDPLVGRTTHVPAGRPLAGSPPFTWEQSASDAIIDQKLNAITDWSLESALYHWHRYNGINNEYKRRGIPTPYLWSGSAHYVKGKYVADRQFSAEAVSKQLGAAVLLRTLIDLGAVTMPSQAISPGAPAGPPVGLPAGPPASPVGAPGSAAGTNANVDLVGTTVRHVAQELNFPGALRNGAGATAAERAGTKRVQEWLTIHGLATTINAAFDAATAEQLKAFQSKMGRPASGELDEETWALLTAPMRRALTKIENAGAMPLEQLVARIAQQHLAQSPIEVGGNNRGPWVRLYMEAKEGEEQAWCAGFVCTIVAQAARELGIGMPFERRVWVPTLVEEARARGRLVSESELPGPQQRHQKLKPGDIFVVRTSPVMWAHTGFVLAVNDDSFDTIEGNTGADGGFNGANAKTLRRKFANIDFLHPQ